jgi:hypothetical protein
MKFGIEPKGVDLIVESHEYTEKDTELMSMLIQHYKKTGELLNFGDDKTNPKKVKVSTAKH